MATAMIMPELPLEELLQLDNGVEPGRIARKNPRDQSNKLPNPAA